MFCIGTYNISHCVDYSHYLEDGQEPVVISATASAIRDMQVDCIGLNEVCTVCPQNEDMVDQPQKLQQATAFEHVVFARGVVLPWGQDLGNALLSRYPIVSHQAIPVLAPTPEQRRAEETEWYEDRVILSAVVDFGRPVKVITTHFGLNLQEKERMVAALAKEIDSTQIPLIVMGDFNAQPHDPVLQPLYDRLDCAADVTGCHECTFASYQPEIEIDYFFVSKDIRVLNYDVVKTVVSDHFPCRMQWEFR